MNNLESFLARERMLAADILALSLGLLGHASCTEFADY